LSIRFAAKKVKVLLPHKIFRSVDRVAGNDCIRNGCKQGFRSLGKLTEGMRARIKREVHERRCDGVEASSCYIIEMIAAVCVGDRLAVLRPAQSNYRACDRQG